MALSIKEIQNIQKEHQQGVTLREILETKNIASSTFYKTAKKLGFQTVEYEVILKSGVSGPYGLFVDVSEAKTGKWKNDGTVQKGKISRVRFGQNDTVEVKFSAYSEEDTVQLELKWSGKTTGQKTLYPIDNNRIEENATYRFT